MKGIYMNANEVGYASVNSMNIWVLRFEMTVAIVLILLLAYAVFKYKNKAAADKFLCALLLVISGVFACDYLVNIYDSVAGSFIYGLQVAGNFGYYLFNYLAIWLIIRYSYEVVKESGGVVTKSLYICSDVAMALSAIMLIVNCFTNVVYYIDANNEYHRGVAFGVSLVPVVTLVAILLIFLVIYRKFLNANDFFVVFAFITLPLLAEALQVMNFGFSWQPIAMSFTAFIVAMKIYLRGNVKKGINQEADINQEGKVMQTRIIVLVCVVIVAFFGVIARIAVGLASSQMDKEIEAHYQLLANNTTEQVSVWMVKETQILINQKVSLEINDNFDHDFLTEYFTKVDEDYNYDSYFYDIYFTSTKNEMSAGSGYIPDPSIDFTKREWYIGAQSSDNICYTAPYIDADSGKYVVTVSTRVFDKNRKFVGVLALDIFVDRLFDIATNQDLPDGSYLFVTDNNLEMVSHPNEEFGYRDGAPQNIMDLGLKEYETLAEHMKSNGLLEKYITLTDYDGVKRCFFVSTVEDCGWYVVAAIPQKVIDQSRRNLNQSVFVALIVCLILGITLTMWLSNNIIKKLSDAQEEAKAASEAKSRFLANMSHEIRTPINAVLGMDEMLLRECKDEHLIEYARNIRSAGQALLGVVNDILDFSKIESDRLDLVQGDYDLGELIGSCINLIGQRASDKGLTFNTTRDDYLPRKLYGDEIRIRQIISNLLTNAVKYTKKGSVTLSVAWDKDSEENGNLRISVEDTGMGIKQESMDDLFESFQRIDEKKNRNIEGTGLGLAITKRLIDLMGGNIEVESTYGKGTKFTVTLPQKVVDAANTKNFGVDKSEKAKDEIKLVTKNARILVVDDVSMNLKVAVGLLKGTGLTIDTAKSGMETIELVKNNNYDLIFLDHMMPEMDGIETFKVLRDEHIDRIEGVPVIMLTANAVMGVEEQYKKEGFAGYLSKPVTRKSLIKCLIEQLPKEKIVEGI